MEDEISRVGSMTEKISKYANRYLVLGFVLISIFTIVLVKVNAEEIEAVQEKTARVVSYWSFDEVDKFSVHDGIGANDFILLHRDYLGTQKSDTQSDGIPIGPQLTENSKFGKAMDFDGMENYGETLSEIEALKETSSLSSTFWFRTEKLPQDKQTIVQLLGDGTGSKTIQTFDETGVQEKYEAVLSVGLDNKGLIVTFLKNDDSTDEIVYEDIPIGEWVHIAVILDNGQISLYVNNEKKESRQTGDLKDTGNYLLLGADAKGNFFKGSIDEVRVYDGAISEQQIQDDMNNLSPKTPPEEEIAEDEETGSGETAEISEMIGKWTFDRSSIEGGIKIKDSINQFNGVLSMNTPETPKEEKDDIETKIVKGKAGEALLLDGVDDFVTVSHNKKLALSDSEKFTLSAWIKPESRDGYEFQIIVRKRPDKYGDPWPYSLNLDKKNTHVQFSLATGNKDIDRFAVLQSKAEIQTGKWTLVTAVLQEGKMKLYINGLLDSEQEFTGAVQPTTARALSMGAAENFEGNFNGAIDDVRIYNYALNKNDFAYLGYDLSAPTSIPSPTPATASTTCSQANPSLCYTPADCTSAGGAWNSVSKYCSPTSAYSPSAPTFPAPSGTYCMLNAKITTSCICGISTKYTSGYCCGTTQSTAIQRTTAC